MNLFIFVICALIAHASSQFYYFGQPAIYQIPQINPSYSTFHGNPNYLRVPGSINQFQTVPGSIPEPVAAPTERPSMSDNNGEYRGFAYQTTTQNGASSHVLFLTGPQAHQINTRVYNNFQRHAFGDDINSNNNGNDRARTVASDMVDSTLPNNIQDIYNPPVQRVDNSEQFFRSFFQSTPQTRLINFYSTNNDLFAQPAVGYPANVFPLTQDIISSRFAETNTTDDNRNDTEVTAESIRTDTRFSLNHFQDMINNKEEDTTRTTQTPEDSINFGSGSESTESLSSLPNGSSSLVRAEESLTSLDINSVVTTDLPVELFNTTLMESLSDNQTIAGALISTTPYTVEENASSKSSLSDLSTLAESSGSSIDSSTTSISSLGSDNSDSFSLSASLPNSEYSGSTDTLDETSTSSSETVSSETFSSSSPIETTSLETPTSSPTDTTSFETSTSPMEISSISDSFSISLNDTTLSSVTTTTDLIYTGEATTLSSLADEPDNITISTESLTTEISDSMITTMQ